MRGFVPVDPETEVSQERYAVINTPRPTRKRFPAGCVEIFADVQAAIESAKQGDNFHAARVIGPSKSSEGQYIYYLVDWLK
jgi:23S rRNA A2030 N6-methylase RlmJ